MLYQKSIEQQFQARRKALGLSQRELARRAGVQQSQVSHFERGGDIRLTSLKQLATGLGLELLAVPQGSDPRSEPGMIADITLAAGQSEPPSLLDIFGDNDEE